MNILVLNSGSSSLKFQLIDIPSENAFVKGVVDGIGLDTCKIKITIDGQEHTEERQIPNHAEGVQVVLDKMKDVAPVESIAGIGHRVVHGGESYADAVEINDDVINVIDQLSELAPLHNPPNLAGIKACKDVLPNVKQVAVFDTAFHQTIPEKAYLYGIPYEWYEKYKIRKYGFHGTSHKYVMLKAKEILNKDPVNIITCHLGNGASVTAIQNNQSMDTSMGFTPLQGLMMGTRSGDLDPAIIAFIAHKENLSVDEIIKVLNKKSGLLGLDGYSDVRTIHEHALQGDKKCQLGLQMFAYRVCEYIGAYEAILDGVNAIIFTGGIGEHAHYLRKLVCEHLWNIGVKLDEGKNNNNETFVNADDSAIKVLTIPTNEELMIARETKSVLGL